MTIFFTKNMLKNVSERNNYIQTMKGEPTKQNLLSIKKLMESINIKKKFNKISASFVYEYQLVGIF